MASRRVQSGSDSCISVGVCNNLHPNHVSSLIQSSGHSQPRTHRGHDAKFPGMAITYALMQRLEELVESDPERVQIIKKARVTSVNKEGNKVTGVSYEFNGENCSVDGVVVLATGGYAADFTETSLLKKHRPDTYNLASTNGTHATGDGLKMLMAIGGRGIDLDKVQVHPTGLVDPKDPGSKWKFLAAEGKMNELLFVHAQLTVMKRFAGREGYY